MLKQKMIIAPVLVLSDFSKIFIVETDAFDGGITSMLMQDNHPIAFIIKSHSKQKIILSTYEKELLAVLFAIKHWKHYLLNGHFIIKTDNISLKYLSEWN